MSTTPTPPSQRSSAASRYVFLFLIGLVVGAIGVIMLMRTWESRKTPEDRWHDAAMNLMAVHNGRLKASIEQNRCAATDLIPSLQAMRMLGNDLEPAFSDLADDRRFKDRASSFRATLDAALAQPPLKCAGAGTTLKKVGEACKACHQEFRGGRVHGTAAGKRTLTDAGAPAATTRNWQHVHPPAPKVAMALAHQGIFPHDAGDF